MEYIWFRGGRRQKEKKRSLIAIIFSWTRQEKINTFVCLFVCLGRGNSRIAGTNLHRISYFPSFSDRPRKCNLVCLTLQAGSLFLVTFVWDTHTLPPSRFKVLEAYPQPIIASSYKASYYRLHQLICAVYLSNVCIREKEGREPSAELDVTISVMSSLENIK